MWKQYHLIRCRPLPLGGKLNTGPWHNKAETKWTPFRRQHFQKHSLNENVWIAIKIPLKFVPKVWIKNIPALVQIMAWHRLGDKPLSEPMMVCSLTHICVTRPQWVKAETKLPTILQTKFVPNGPINNIPALVQIMAWRRSGYKPLSEPMIRLPTHICVARPQWVKAETKWPTILQTTFSNTAPDIKIFTMPTLWRQELLQ